MHVGRLFALVADENFLVNISCSDQNCFLFNCNLLFMKTL